jgi:hypothetical protein
MLFRSLAFAPLLAGALGATVALATPRPAAAEKLPVDCSGRRSSCYERRQCTRYVEHVCVERTTEYWYWYFSEPSK